MRYAALFCTLLLAACNWASNAPAPANVGVRAAGAGFDEPVLRVLADRKRERIWVLGLEHLGVYDARTNAVIRRIVLPRWVVADFLCEPDIVLDGTGAAYISHNLQAKLWRIDPGTFELSEHALGLSGREDLDIGFGKLAFAEDGALFAVASTGGSLWRIDLASSTARAVEVGASMRPECAFR